MVGVALVRGRLPMELGNAVSDAIHGALSKGMETDEAVCIVAAVAADYGRGAYGPGYCNKLAKVVKRQATMPLPMAAVP